MNIKLLFEGDSITNASRNRLDQQANRSELLGCGYANLVASHLLARSNQVKIFNRAIAGDKASDVLARSADILTTIKPNWLSLLIGINDIWHTLSSNQRPDPQAIATTLEQYLLQLQQHHPELKIIMIEPFALLSKEVSEQWFTFLQPLQQLEQQLAEKYRCIWIPTQTALNLAAASLGTSHILWDGVHPTPAGHSILAKQWLEHTQSLQTELGIIS